MDHDDRVLLGRVVLVMLTVLVGGVWIGFTVGLAARLALFLIGVR